jgi:ribonuclease BN (tRNA processing enzyme)
MSDSVTFLGTSDGLPSPDRHHASLLLRLAGQTILLDCGEPCSHTLKRTGFDFNSLDAVVITHSHSDHIGGFPMLVQSLWLEQRARPLPVFLPAGIVQPLRDWMHACYLFEQQLGFKLHWHPLGPGKIGEVTLRTCRSSHLDSTQAHFATLYPKVAFEAFVVTLEGNGKRLAYSGDIGEPRDLAPLFAVDLLVCELAHFHPQKLADFLKEKPVKQLVLTHLSRQAREQWPEVQRIFPNAIFAKDGDTISL